jgi:alpha-amylase
MRKIVILLISLILLTNASFSQQRVKKVLFQGFWWDYWNSNFPNKWSDYLTEMAPRLKAIGIDAVWIPPTSKGSTRPM